MTKVCVFEHFVLEETVHHVLVRGPPFGWCRRR